jgi:hypothetical protein
MKKILSKYRGRGARKWSDNTIDPEYLFNKPLRNKNKTKTFDNDKNHDESDSDDDMSSERKNLAKETIDRLIAEQQGDGSIDTMQREKLKLFTEKSCSAIELLFNNNLLNDNENNNNNNNNDMNDIVSNINITKINEINEKLKDKIIIQKNNTDLNNTIKTNSNNNSYHDRNPSMNTSENRIVPNPKILSFQELYDLLTDQQLIEFKTIQNSIDIFNDTLKNQLNSRSHKQIKRFCHGGPGAGKSFLIETVTKYASLYNIDIIILAPYGSQANIIDGETIHGITHMSRKINPNIRQTDINDFRINHSVDRLWGIIIDEISTAQPDLFYVLNLRLQKILDNSKDFGGLSVILFGDFFQLPPAKPPTTLVDVVVRKYIYQENLKEYADKAADLFFSFIKTELLGNIRAANDKKWMNMIFQLRIAKPDYFPFHRHFLPDIDSLILTNNIINNDREFIKAPIIVTGNFHRTSIILSRSTSVARDLGVPSIR